MQCINILICSKFYFVILKGIEEAKYVNPFIFNRKYLNEHLNKFNINTIPNLENSINIIKKWKISLENKNLDKTKEVSVQGLFLTHIFRDILGYSDMVSSETWNLTIEKKTQHDMTVADGALGFFTSKTEDTKVVIELKDAKTELDRKQNRLIPYSPVEQAFGYQAKYRDCRWIIVSNIREIRLYNSKTMTSYESFLVENLVDEMEFKKFYFLLNRKHLISEGHQNSLIDTIYINNEIEEKEITNEFYKLYKNIRVNLHKHLIENNKNLNELLLLEKTQKILDRLIFIRFSEDSNLLPKKTFQTIVKYANESFSRSETKIWDGLKDLFESVDKGNERKGINHFNGGLFRFDSVLDTLIIKDSIFSEIEKILNYDFKSEVDVNLLGHIFEQSISDLEEIKAELNNEIIDKKKSKRKQHGVFYTPQFITSFLVRKVIDDWLMRKRIELREDDLNPLTDEDYKEYYKKLSNKRVKKITNVEKHITFYEQLQDALRNIKILDPSCGSGAFLNAAFDYLIIVSSELNRILEHLSGEQSLFNLDNHILKHNLYGVDLNKESVEITKLSLWIKTASANDPLTTLDDNIKFGNSLISDKQYDLNGFDWNEEFKDVFSTGGFDIILGNPPYVYAREKITEIQKDYYLNNYISAQYQINTFPLFIEKSINLLKDNGLIGFIVPDTLLKLSAISELRKFMLETGSMDTIVQLLGKSFEDAGVETVAFIYNKSIYNNLTRTAKFLNAKNLNSDFQLIDNSNWSNDDEYRFLISIDNQSNTIIDKLNNTQYVIDDRFDVKSGLKAYEAGKGNPKQSKEDVKERPYDFDYKYDDFTFKYLDGKDLIFYSINWDNKWLKYGENLAAPRSFDIFSNPRILIREITADFPRSFVTTYTEDTFLNNLSLINVLHKENNKNELKILLMYLSSELYAFYFNKTNPKSERKLFPKLILKDLKKFPFVIPDNFEPYINLMDTLLTLHEERYSKINMFLNRLNTRLGLKKPSKKLLDFYKLNFNELLLELKKNKVTLSLSEEDEWEKYFNDYKNEIDLNINKSTELFKTLDNYVYELFKITHDEIDFIKNDMLSNL